MPEAPVVDLDKTVSAVDKWTKHKLPDGARTFVVGVHRVIYVAPPPFQLAMPGKNIFGEQMGTLSKTLPSVRWLFGELYTLGPVAYPAMLALTLVLDLLPTATLFLNHRVLSLIEEGFKTKEMDSRAIAITFGLEMACSLLEMAVRRASTKLTSKMEMRASLHFKYLAIQARLAREYAQVPDPNINNTRYDAWFMTAELLRGGGTLVSFATQTVLLHRLLSTVESRWLTPALFAVWGIRTFIPSFGQSSFRMQVGGLVSHAVNTDYLRLAAVSKLATDEYQQEVQGLNLGEHILQTYKACEDRLSGFDTRSATYVMRSNGSNILVDLVKGRIDMLPTVYYIVCAILGWPTFSFATISSVQRISSNLRRAGMALFGRRSLAKTLKDIDTFRASLQLPPDPDSDLDPYPSVKVCQPAGMEIEFRDVTFSYPTSKTKSPAISNLSFSISPGQLVVIVGPNGVGKSTLVKLLTRTHEPTSGTILIDRHDAKVFRLGDLREASAVLSQDHQILGGVSVAESVGLGRWRHKDNQDLVKEAMRLGGAEGFVRKLELGEDTVLRPVNTKNSLNLTSDHPLLPTQRLLDKETDVSGGEKQRLVAARTFMRMNTGTVRLVVVDEPSSAMDPAGEYELFKRLREARQGKTMIFITHRFGHLTKHADLILCMKEGKLVEQGTHAELIAMEGEYFDLYNIQAQAFTPGDL